MSIQVILHWGTLSLLPQSKRASGTERRTSWAIVPRESLKNALRRSARIEIGPKIIKLIIKQDKSLRSV